MIIPFWDNYLKVDVMEFRLKKLRKQKKITQIKLAMDLGLTQNSVSRFETGLRRPDYETLILIADYFHVSLDYLVGRSDDPHIHK